MHFHSNFAWNLRSLPLISPIPWPQCDPIKCAEKEEGMEIAQKTLLRRPSHLPFDVRPPCYPDPYSRNDACLYLRLISARDNKTLSWCLQSTRSITNSGFTNLDLFFCKRAYTFAKSCIRKMHDIYHTSNRVREEWFSNSLSYINEYDLHTAGKRRGSVIKSLFKLIVSK